MILTHLVFMRFFRGVGAIAVIPVVTRFRGRMGLMGGRVNVTVPGKRK